MTTGPSNNQLTARFRLQKDTKGTFKYEEIDERGNPSVMPVSGTVYIRKAMLAAFHWDKAPSEITATFALKE